jgi:hypothetical protein
MYIKTNRQVRHRGVASNANESCESPVGQKVPSGGDWLKIKQKIVVLGCF